MLQDEEKNPREAELEPAGSLTVEKRFELLESSLTEQWRAHIIAINHLYWRLAPPGSLLTEEDASLGISYKYASLDSLWDCATKKDLGLQECEKLISAAPRVRSLIGPTGQSPFEYWLRIAHQALEGHPGLEADSLGPLLIAKMLFEDGRHRPRRRPECRRLCRDMAAKLELADRRERQREWRLVVGLRDRI
jgi:hypothetical protein